MLGHAVYTGGAKGQILNGDANWLHGHWNGNAGVARYVNGWQTAVQDNVNPDTDWVVMCGGNAGWSQLTLVNGVDVGTPAGGTGGVSLLVTYAENYGQNSGFAIAEVVVWPRSLTSEEMRSVSEHLMNRMG